jgi:hypothetical protein
MYSAKTYFNSIAQGQFGWVSANSVGFFRVKFLNSYIQEKEK